MKENKTKKNNILYWVAGIIPVIILVLVIVSAISYAANDDNNNQGINSEQVINGIKVSDGIIVQENGIYNYSAKATNTNEETTHVEYLTLSLYNSNNEKIVTLYGYIGKDLAKDESVPILASVDKDVSNATKVEIEVKN